MVWCEAQRRLLLSLHFGLKRFEEPGAGVEPLAIHGAVRDAEDFGRRQPLPLALRVFPFCSNMNKYESQAESLPRVRS